MGHGSGGKLMADLKVVAEHRGLVTARTGIGGTRVVDVPAGELLPRICQINDKVTRVRACVVTLLEVAVFLRQDVRHFVQVAYPLLRFF